MLIQSSAQNRYVNWFFGFGSGLKFENNGPVVVNGGKTATQEGVATMSDPCGNLLFYSDGTAIWNKKHALMANGSGLNGDNQSAEAVLIVPLPLSDSIYYVFTTGSYANANGVQYSIVDMSLQSGDGQVISKNNKLYGKSSEKLTAILHANKKDYWILTHDWDNAKYKVYLLNESGLTTTPNEYSLGPVTNTNVENALGHLRPSPDGSMVASSFWYGNKVDLYKFNNSNGNLSLITTLTNFDHQRPYSLEFSPDNTILYVGEAATSTANDIYQFDVNSANIAGSRYKITTATYRFGNFGIGPDGKFYIAKFDQNSLGIISNPNTFGSGVNYLVNGFNLGSQKSMLGLPNPIFPIVNQNPEYAMSIIPGCKLSDPVKFEMLSNFCYDSILWDLSDFSSGNNYSRKKKLTHVYPFKGNYDVTLYVYQNGKEYKYNKNIKVPSEPSVNLGKDTFFCGNFSYLLDGGNPGTGAKYSWNDGYTGQLRNVNTPGLYSVKVTVGNCSASDTVLIKVGSGLKLGFDTTICFANTFLCDLNVADSVVWSDSQDGKTRSILSPGGIYYATIYKNKCFKKDTFTILLPNLYPNPLPNDTSVCDGDTLKINLTNSAINYLWNDASTNGVKGLSKDGFYRLIQTAGNCIKRDSINLKVIPNFNIPTVNDTSICKGDTLNFKLNLNYTNFTLNGIPDSRVSYNFYKSGSYLFKAENLCYKDSISFNLNVDSCVSLKIFFPSIFSPNSDQLNDFFKPTFLGDTSKIFSYEFKIFNRWGGNIFKSFTHSVGWDGSYLETPCQGGHYLWTCTIRYLEYGEPQKQDLKGLLFLIR